MKMMEILLYSTPGGLVEVYVVRSEAFVSSNFIRQCCPLSSLLYILALGHFLRNPVIRELSLPVATHSARYSAYVDVVSILVSSRSGIDEVGKAISGYEMVKGTKINRKSVDLLLVA